MKIEDVQVGKRYLVRVADNRILIGTCIFKGEKDVVMNVENLGQQSNVTSVIGELPRKKFLGIF